MKPYNPDACCGAHCFAFRSNNQAEPCWGDVSVASEIEIGGDEDGPDSVWVHECEGHADCFEDGGTYKADFGDRQ
jgi:hypothetical protein